MTETTERDRIAQNFIDNDVYLNVTGMATKLLEVDEDLVGDLYAALDNASEPCGECSECEAENPLSCEDTQYPEIYQWWAVSNMLAQELEALCEPLIHDMYGQAVWGRTCCGQSIHCDGTMQKVADRLIERTPKL